MTEITKMTAAMETCASPLQTTFCTCGLLLTASHKGTQNCCVNLDCCPLPLARERASKFALLKRILPSLVRKDANENMDKGLPGQARHIPSAAGL